MTASAAEGALFRRAIVAALLLPLTWGWALPLFMLLDPLATERALTSGGGIGLLFAVIWLGAVRWRLRAGLRGDFAYETTRDFTALVVIAALLRWMLDSDAARMPYVESFSLLALHIGVGFALAMGVYVGCRKETRRHPKELGGHPLPGVRRVFTVTGAALGLIAAIVIGVGTAARSDGALDRARVDELRVWADIVGAGMNAAETPIAARRVMNVASVDLAMAPVRLPQSQQPAWFDTASAMAPNGSGWILITHDGRRLHAAARAVGEDRVWMAISANTRPPLQVPNDVSALLTLAVFLLLAPLAAWLVANDLSTQLIEISASLRRLGPASPSEADRTLFTSNLDRTREALLTQPGIPVTSNDEAGELAVELNAACRRFGEENARLARALSVTRYSDRAQGLLLQAASHDLRTPLTSISGFCHLLEQTGLSDGQREDVGVIAQSTQQLLAHVEEILDLSRIEAGREAPLKLEPVDLGALARDVLAAQRETASPAITIQLSVARDLYPVLADTQRIRQVLQNLISNALKFTREGFVDVTVSTDQMSDGRPAIHVQVTDSGPGIAESELELIFEEFYRVAERRQVAGTGLGLAIARRLVKRHGGRIWAESALGNGAVFHLLLPEGAV